MIEWEWTTDNRVVLREVSPEDAPALEAAGWTKVIRVPMDLKPRREDVKKRGRKPKKAAAAAAAAPPPRDLVVRMVYNGTPHAQEGEEIYTEAPKRAYVNEVLLSNLSASVRQGKAAHAVATCLQLYFQTKYDLLRDLFVVCLRDGACVSPFLSHAAFALWMMENPDDTNHSMVANATLYAALRVVRDAVAQTQAVPRYGEASSAGVSAAVDLGVPTQVYDTMTENVFAEPDIVLDKGYVAAYPDIETIVLDHMAEVADPEKAALMLALPMRIAVGGRLLHTKILCHAAPLVTNSVLSLSLSSSGVAVVRVAGEFAPPLPCKHALDLAVPQTVNMQGRMLYSAVNAESCSMLDMVSRHVHSSFAVDADVLRRFTWAMHSQRTGPTDPRAWTRIPKERPSWWTPSVARAFESAIKYYWRSSSWQSFVGKLAHDQRPRLTRDEAVRAEGPIKRRFETHVRGSTISVTTPDATPDADPPVPAPSPSSGEKEKEKKENGADADADAARKKSEPESQDQAQAQSESPPQKKRKIVDTHEIVARKMKSENERRARLLAVSKIGREEVAKMHRNLGKTVVNNGDVGGGGDKRVHIHAKPIIDALLNKKKKEKESGAGKGGIVIRRQQRLC